MILGKTNIDAQKAAELAADKVRMKEDEKEIESLLKEIKNINIKDFLETHEYIIKQGGRVYSTYEAKLNGLFSKIRDERNIYSFHYCRKDMELFAKREELSSNSYDLKINLDDTYIKINHVNLHDECRIAKSTLGKICVYSNNGQFGEETTKVINYLKEIISLLKDFMQRYIELVESLTV